LIVEHACGWKLAAQIMRDKEDLSAPVLSEIERIVEQRCLRVPLQYCLGHAHFRGREFIMKPGVFIPRPETELLVEGAVRLLGSARTLAEVGTGSGAIIVSLLKELPQVQAIGIDLSAEAVELTRKNAIRHQVMDRLTLLQGDWPETLPGGLDGIVCNPPYIPRSLAATLDPEVGQEPELALFGSDIDGLGFYRQLSLKASEHLKPGGFLIVEVGDQQANDVARILAGDGWRNLEMLTDIQGMLRTVSAQSRLTNPQNQLSC